MPRYFFDTVDGARIRDTVGIELADPHAARVAAIQLIGRLLAEEPRYLWDGHDFRVEVTNYERRLVCTVVALAIDAADPISNQNQPEPAKPTA